MRAVGDIMVMSPPLIISRQQIDDLYDIAWASLDQTMEQLKK
jgi:putrescine aminotransferase